jgi:DNA polymerase-3 subunit delta'
MTATPVLGHDACWRQLTAALDHDRLAHALLFAGPEGIGKCLVARTLAAYAFCCGESPRPCGACPSCRQVAAASHPDYTFVQVPAGKRDIGIDLIRELKRTVHRQAVAGGRHVAIVDDAERMSVAAQNALLKTLEEPPGPALLILVTASPGALLSTVRSRCQLVRFQPLEPAAVATVLARVADLDADTARLLAAAADGSPGRALRHHETWEPGEQARLLALLAELHPARYVSVLRMSKALGRTEQEAGARLEALQAWYRDAARHAVARQPVARADAARAVRGFEAVTAALQQMRRRSPNRALLADALLLRLARG